LKDICEIALRQYEAKYRRCYFTFPDGDQCIIRAANNHMHHESTSHRRAQGKLKPKHTINISEFVKSTRQLFIDYYGSLATKGELGEQYTGNPPQYIPIARREQYMQEYHEEWRRIRSNKTCLACLQQVPENVLQCGHAFCVVCVQELGAESQDYDSAWVMCHCPLCWDHQDVPHLVRLKPRCAGVRILTLDGGGVRGIIELALLKRLDEETGLGINFRDFFDLIIGTSTGKRLNNYKIAYLTLK